MKTPVTIVISGLESITNTIIKFQSNIQKIWCACVDSSIPEFSMSEKIRRGYICAKERGVEIRYVTEITKENLPYCKGLMQFVDLRYLEEVSGSFAVSENEFVAGIRGKKTLEKLIYSNVREVVAAQQSIFETLWQNSVPAAVIIADLEG